MVSDGRGRSVLRSLVPALLAGVLLIGTAVPSGAVPPAPPNPSDDEIQQSQEDAQASAAEVGRLSGLVTTTEGDIQRLQDTMELKAELAMKSKIDLQLAQEDAANAKAAADSARKTADAASEAIRTAQAKAAEFAAASFRQGSVLGSMSVLVGADSAGDLLDRDELIRQISASQLEVIGDLQAARNAKANKDSAARAALDKATEAQQKADAAKTAADTAQQTASAAFETGRQQLADLQTTLATQQEAYQQAMSNVAGLQAQREQYNQWLAAKKAEEERLRREAEERARKAEAARQAAAAAAARAAAAEAERERVAAIAAAQAAAEEAAAAKAAREEAAAKAAAAQAAREQAAAKAAQQRREEAAASARRVAAERRAAAARAASAAAAEKVRKDRAAQAARNRAAIEKANRDKLNADEAARAARERQLQAERDRDADAEMHGKGTGAGSYFQNCDAARAAGAAPMKKGDPGYRKELDPNGNGVACDAGTSSEPGQSGSSGPISVPSDGSRGAAVVNAALAWLGTQYAWGGGDSNGPTLGIRDGGTADAYGDYMKVGFDCSGLALYAWAQVGIALPHYSGYQYFSGQHVSLSQLQPGDLVFFAYNTSDPSTIHHVAIYAGNNQMIESPNSGSYVKVSPLRTSGYIGATRPGT